MNTRTRSLLREEMGRRGHVSERAWLDEMRRPALTYGKSLVAEIRERQQHISRAVRNLLEPDPMNITITMREISNGVIVSTDQPEGYGTSRPLGEQFFPTWEIAMSELPGIAAEARERPRHRDAMRQEFAQRQARNVTERHAFSEGVTGTATDDIASWVSEPGVGVERLPEEAAALGETGAMETNTFNDDGDSLSAGTDTQHGYVIGGGHLHP